MKATAPLKKLKGLSFEDRFWARVEKTATCWLWHGYRNKWGYGRVTKGISVTLMAHRVSWEFANGPIPAGLYVCHTCDNPPCVNPEHLFLGTQLDNIRDASRKGRMPGNPHPCTDTAKAKIGAFFRGRPGTPHTEETKKHLAITSASRFKRRDLCGRFV